MARVKRRSAPVACLHAARRSLTDGRFSRGSGDRLSDGEINRHRGASADGTFYGGQAARLLGKPVDLAEAKAGTFTRLPGGEQRLKDARKHLRWHAHAIIHESNPNI
jgi:hypothetical protein